MPIRQSIPSFKVYRFLDCCLCCHELKFVFYWANIISKTKTCPVLSLVLWFPSNQHYSSVSIHGMFILKVTLQSVLFLCFVLGVLTMFFITRMSIFYKGCFFFDGGKFCSNIDDFPNFSLFYSR